MANYRGYRGIITPTSSFTKRFAEKTRYDSMIEQMDEESKRRYVQDTGFREYVNKDFGFDYDMNNPIFQNPKYTTNLEEPKKRGALDKVIDFLSAGNYASAGFAMGLAKDEGIGGALERAGKGFVAGFTGDDENSYRYGDVLNEIGWKKEENPDGKWYNPLTWSANNVKHNLTGFIGDVVLDPTTYLGVGLVDDLARGTGKVVKGTIAGSDDIVKTVGKGVGKKSVIKEATSDEALKVFKSLKGENYIPKANEVNEWIRRTNELRGIRKSQPVTFAGKKIISGDKMDAIRNPIRTLGDKTIAPYTQRLGDMLKHSKLSTKGDLIDLARSNPQGLKTYFDWLDEAGKHGLEHAQAIEGGTKLYERLKNSDDAVDKLTLKLMEDKNLYNKMNGKLVNETQDYFNRDILKGEQQSIDKKILDNKPTAEESNIIDLASRSKDKQHFKGYDVIRKKSSIPNDAKVISADNVPTKELSNGKIVSTKLSVEKGRRNIPNPYDYRDSINDVEKITKQYDNIDYIPKVDDSRVAKTGHLYLKGTDYKVDYMRPGYLDNAGVTELKKIGKELRIPYWNKYTSTNKDGLVKAIKDYFEPKTHVRSARLQSNFLKNYKQSPENINSFLGDLTFQGKRKIINEIVKEDKYMNNLYKHFINNKRFSTANLSEKELSEFITKYFEGDMDYFINTSHRLNRDYGVVSKILNEEFGDYTKLSKSEKALRMNKMWDYYNNPKLLNQKVRQLEMKNSFGTKGIDAEVAMDLERVTGTKRVNVNGRTLYEKPKIDRVIDDVETQINKQNKRISEFETKRFKNNVEYAGTKATNDNVKFNNIALNKTKKSSLSNVDDEVVKQLDDIMINKNTNIPDSLAYKMIESELSGKKLTNNDVLMAIKELKTGKVDKALSEASIGIDEEVKQTVKKIKNLSEDKYEYVDNLLDMAKAKIQREPKVLTQVDEIKTTTKNIINNEKIIEDTVKLTDTEKLALKQTKELRQVFKQMGFDEVKIGKLNSQKFEGMMNNYIAHIMTPEAKGLWESLKKSNPDIYNMMKTGNKGNQFAITRHFTKGTVLPDGYKLKTGSIDEINEHMAQYLNGNKMFVDKVSDIYFGRLKAHEAIMYDYKLADDMVGKFGVRMESGKGLSKGESGIIKTADVKKALNKATPEQKIEFYKRLDIEEGYFEGTYKPFMKLTPMQASYFSSSKSIPVYKVNNVIIDKADKLAKNQFATDMHVLTKVFDKFQTLWKTAVTAIRPGFHARNAQSNAFQNYLDVGARAYNPIFNKKILDIVTGKEGTHSILGKKYTFQQLREKAVQYGVFDKGFFEKDLELGDVVIKNLDGKINPKYNPFNVKEFGVYKAGRKVGNTVENQARMANFVANLERGKSFQEASEHVNKFLFDYSDLTDFEHNVMKRIVPFYTWLRKNVPLQAEMLLSAPQKYLPFTKAIDILSEDNNNKPNYAQDWVQLPFTTKDSDGKEYNIMWNNSLPYNDLRKLTSAKQMWGGVTPFIKIPVELIAGKNIFFDQDIKGQRASYLKDQVPGVYETEKIASSTGGKKAVALSDNIVGSGLKTMETEESRKNGYEKDKFSYIYKRYLKEKENK